MRPRSSQSSEPTLKTVTDLILKVHKELKGELKDVRETVEFLKENAVTRDELHGELDLLRSDLSDKIRETRNEMINHVDHFVQLHKKQEVELVALAHRMNRHEETHH
jgi:hypothetical protein